MSNSNDGYDFFRQYMEKENEERRIQQEENQIRYASRRAEKMKYRCQIEEAAGKICDMINAEAEKGAESRKPEGITALAAALAHASMALQTAEGYAESRPFYSGELFLGGGCRT